jgi:hypothetical protein
MEWFIIILLIIFVIMVMTLKPLSQTQKVMCNKNITMNDSYKESKDLVMLPNPNPTPLTTHITL